MAILHRYFTNIHKLLGATLINDHSAQKGAIVIVYNGHPGGQKKTECPDPLQDIFHLNLPDRKISDEDADN